MKRLALFVASMLFVVTVVRATEGQPAAEIRFSTTTVAIQAGAPVDPKRIYMDNVVFVMNSGSLPLMLNEVDQEGASVQEFPKLFPKTITVINYEPHEAIRLQVKVYDGHKWIFWKNISFKPAVRDFTGGTWVWVIDDKTARITQNLACLPKKK